MNCTVLVSDYEHTSELWLFATLCHCQRCWSSSSMLTNLAVSRSKLACNLFIFLMSTFFHFCMMSVLTITYSHGNSCQTGSRSASSFYFLKKLAIFEKREVCCVWLLEVWFSPSSCPDTIEPRISSISWSVYLFLFFCYPYIYYSY